MAKYKATLLLLTIGILILFTVFGLRAHNSDNQKPNIIIIYTDDQGSIDMNCYGATDLYTPHMDRLAQTGVRFTQFYAAAAVCSPSRAALLTGKTPRAAGLASNASSQKGGHGGLPAGETTLAEVLKGAGYTTGHIGKWHLGYTPETMPNAQGFDYSFGHMGGCIDNYSHFFYWNGPNVHDLWRNGEEVWYDGQHFAGLMATEADQFITKNKENPFFLYYAINMPHYPLQGMEKWREHYQDLASPRKEYAAFVSTIDEHIGQLTGTLETLGLRENTIIILQSDHGHSTEIRTMGGGGNAGPYRGAKFSFFEGGIRVPAIISWPGKIPQGEVREQMAFNVDWFPTVLKYAGITPPDIPFDGKDMTSIIAKEKAKNLHNTFFWASNNGMRWAVRKDEWKLLYRPEDTSDKAPVAEGDSLFLVNLTHDVGEMKNLAAKEPEKVRELREMYKSWADKYAE